MDSAPSPVDFALDHNMLCGLSLTTLYLWQTTLTSLKMVRYYLQLLHLHVATLNSSTLSKLSATRTFQPLPNFSIFFSEFID